MMGRLKSDQSQLFYEFDLSDAVPEDHLVRKIDAVLDLSWLRGERAILFVNRPSIDPELMILCVPKTSKPGRRGDEVRRG